MAGSDRDHTAILFVCIGNICRSPMAAAIGRKHLPGRVKIASAGIAPYGGSAAPEAIKVMRDCYDVDIMAHRSRGVREFTLETFDIIVAMDIHVYSYLKDTCRVGSERLIRWEINDPFMCGLEAFRVCAGDIADAMNEIWRIVEGRADCVS